MSGRIEAVRDYVLTLARRSIGIDGFNREYQLDHLSRVEFTSPRFEAADRRASQMTALMVGGVHQFLLPTTYEIFKRYKGKDWIPLAMMGGMAADITTTTLSVTLSHNPAETAVLRTFTNAATNAVFDLGENIIQRTRNFRTTTPATLTI